MKSDRRNFLKNAASASAAFLAAPAFMASGQTVATGRKISAAEKPFKLKYAPYLDMFHGTCRQGSH